MSLRSHSDTQQLTQSVAGAILALPTHAGSTHQAFQVVLATQIGQSLAMAMEIARQPQRQRQRLHLHPHQHHHQHQHHLLLRPRTENVAGANGVMHLRAAIIQPGEAVQFVATTVSLSARAILIVTIQPHRLLRQRQHPHLRQHQLHPLQPRRQHHPPPWCQVHGLTR